MKIIEVRFCEPILGRVPGGVCGGDGTAGRVSVRYTQRPSRTYHYTTIDDDPRPGDLYLVCPPAGLRAVSVASVMDAAYAASAGVDVHDLKPVLCRLASCDGETAQLVLPVQVDQPPPQRWYVVRAGDTLIGIANSMDIPYDELLDINRGSLPDPNLIRVGQRLLLPRPRPRPPAVGPESRARVMHLLAHAMAELSKPAGSP